MKRIRIIATLLAMVMVLGSSMSVFATTSVFSDSTTNGDAHTTITGWYADVSGYHVYESNHRADVENNAATAGYYLTRSQKDGFTDAAIDVIHALEALSTDQTLSASGKLSDCRTIETRYNDILSARLYSDGSGLGGSSTSSASSSSSTSSSKTNNDAEENDKKIDEAYNNAVSSVKNVSSQLDAGLKSLNTVLASGDAAQKQAAMQNGVVIDTTWKNGFSLQSLSKNAYKDIEKATLAGIPVTIKFIHVFSDKELAQLGLKEANRAALLSVKIPAGAKVTDLCDDKGWCGFMNLAAKYGFKIESTK